jgi:hypothetical protein
LALGAQESLSHVVDGLLEENQVEDVCVDSRLTNLIYKPEPLVFEPSGFRSEQQIVSTAENRTGEIARSTPGLLRARLLTLYKSASPAGGHYTKVQYTIQSRPLFITDAGDHLCISRG